MENRWTERISDYVDGTMSTEEARVFEARMAEDDDLAGAVAEVRALVREAGTLEGVDPPEHLWDSIAARLPERHAPVVDLAEERARRGMVFARWQAAAAAITLVILSGAMGWILRGEPAPTPGTLAHGDPPSALPEERRIPVSPLETASARFDEENAHLAESIRVLETTLIERAGELDEETRTIVEDNLILIDQAIRDALRALDQDPDSDYLRNHLARTMKRKARLLEDATRLSRREI